MTIRDTPTRASRAFTTTIHRQGLEQIPLSDS
ncbi:unnamed protein product [Mycetohabitans rhizoxinica HKI 454]|uniref:Uncharacterized protein n=1 Tax=Mycetohabitans rhizoxinica (strain DSM 19002 / CIP 109453 / HKI 454) TaxID=882378 RepID=E5AQW6_MYCRK|nr:unnamed protein product [Mycetohabitans rhizoxinica HKI 454]